MRTTNTLAAVILAMGLQGPMAMADSPDSLQLGNAYNAFRNSLAVGSYIDMPEDAMRLWSMEKAATLPGGEQAVQQMILGAYAVMELDQTRTRKARMQIEDRLEAAMSHLKQYQGEASVPLLSYYLDIGQMYLRLYRHYPATKATWRKGHGLIDQAVRHYLKYSGDTQVERARWVLDVVERIDREGVKSGRYYSVARMLAEGHEEEPLLKAEFDYWQGKRLIRAKDYDSARSMLEGGLQQIADTPGSEDVARKLHSALVAVHQNLGRPADATDHSVAIARLIQAGGAMQVRPIYTETIELHTFGNKLVKGNVTVEFTVDEDGAVRNASVISGPRALQDAALKAISRFRFAPRVENNDVVATNGVIYEFEYIDNDVRDYGQGNRPYHFTQNY